MRHACEERRERVRVGGARARALGWALSYRLLRTNNRRVLHLSHFAPRAQGSSITRARNQSSVEHYAPVMTLSNRRRSRRFHGEFEPRRKSTSSCYRFFVLMYCLTASFVQLRVAQLSRVSQYDEPSRSLPASQSLNQKLIQQLYFTMSF